MIEACLSMAFICLVLFGLLQVSMLYSADEILHHAAVSTARARTVGFNNFMLRKVSQVAAIPNAGPIENPDLTGSHSNPRAWGETPAGQLIDETLNPPTPSPQADLELSRIPLYMGAANPGQLSSILEYRDWDTIQRPQLSFPRDDILEIRISQTYPLSFPLHRAYYADDDIRLRGEARLEDHAELYLQ